MKIYIYCRVAPNDANVAKSDKLKAQEVRCRNFLKSINRDAYKVFYDEGDIHPLHLPSGISSLRNRVLEHYDKACLIICDHEARFGTDPIRRRQIIDKVQSAGAVVLPLSAPSEQ